MGQMGSRASADAGREDIVPSRAATFAGKEIPEELLEQIIEGLAVPYPIRPDHHYQHDHHYPDAVPALTALCRASKQFYRVAQPVLFRTIWPDTSHNSGRRTRCLLRTLIARRHLRDHVRNVSVDLSEKCRSRTAAAGPAVAHDDLHGVSMKAYREAAQELSSLGSDGIKCKRLLKAVAVGQEDASCALLLTICKKIRSIDCDLSVGWRDLMAGRVLEIASGASPRGWAPGSSAPYNLLPTLKELILVHDATQGSTPITSVSFLLSHGALESFQGHALSLQQHELADFVSLTYHLSRVELTHSLVDEAGLRHLLSCCPGLKSFSLEWGPSTVGHCIIRLPGIGDALRQFGQGLARLRLDPKAASHFDEAAVDTVTHAPLGDLTPLASLQTLEVPAMCLVGIDDKGTAPSFQVLKFAHSLPMSMEELTILPFRSKHTSLDEQLTSLVTSERYLHLRKITLTDSNPAPRTLELQCWNGWSKSEADEGGIVVLDRQENQTH